MADMTKQEEKRFEEEAKEIADIACLLINRKALTLELRTTHPYAPQLLLEKVIYSGLFRRNRFSGLRTLAA